MFPHSACPRLQLVSAVAVLLSAAVSSGYAQSADEDLVAQLPGFKVAPFKVFSGYLEVPGPFQQNGYDSLSIHYQVPLISFRATLSYTYACYHRIVTHAHQTSAELTAYCTDARRLRMEVVA